MSPTTEKLHRKMQNIHERLRHDSTADSPDVVRERLRQAEIAQERIENKSKQVDEPDFLNR